MKIWHISDTHTLHSQLPIPKDIDVVIHSGDFANTSESVMNSVEVHCFLEWFINLPIENKVLIGGNHDVSIERGLIRPEDIRDLGIKYLYMDSVTIDGIKIWGTPHTPTFGEKWAWNVARHKISNLWKLIPDDTDILVTHGPPKGILDHSLNRKNELEMCGDKSLLKRIRKVMPALVCFGHIHNMEDCINSGLMTVDNILFSNAACMTDRKEGLTSYGNVLNFNL